ncbi:hypothetical protein FD754_024907 [Muntiacus muntjak]|uniref:MAGE domain-containing protein n=1 Tax=Muntiacus muntjak TaxID=9888 RepID=A0A5N3UMM8_MUNMU|nr:hypothetical protein FD754_024907 [Muntiacus muntjak]
MPRRHKNKFHACVKCHLVRWDTQEAQATAAAAPGEKCPLLPLVSMAPSSPDAEASCAGSDEGAQGPEEESAGASQAATATQSPLKDPLTRKAKMLVEFVLEKYTKKEPIMPKALLKVIKRKYSHHFSEIFRRAPKHMALVFGLELKEVDCSRSIYALINKLNLGGDEGPSDEGELPKSSLLTTLLGVIFIKEFLNVLGVYSGRRHSIYGEPRRLITKDLFLWGPRAYAETSKMKVLEVLAKTHDMVPSSFPDLYEKALRDQVETARMGDVARPPAMAEAGAPSRAKSCNSCHTLRGW